jgi:hypothetical protein
LILRNHWEDWHPILLESLTKLQMPRRDTSWCVLSNLFYCRLDIFGYTLEGISDNYCCFNVPLTSPFSGVFVVLNDSNFRFQAFTVFRFYWEVRDCPANFPLNFQLLKKQNWYLMNSMNAFEYWPCRSIDFLVVTWNKTKKLENYLQKTTQVRRFVNRLKISSSYRPRYWLFEIN